MEDFKIQDGVLLSYREDDHHVVVPEGVTTIGSHAFCCSHTRSVVVADGVVGIEALGFNNCHELENVTLPDSLVYVNTPAFEFCEKLKYNEYEGGFYLGNKNNPYLVLIEGHSLRDGGAVIHKDTKVIGGGALSVLKELDTIVFPNGLKGIGHYSFKWCKKLTTLNIPNSVIHIGTDAFTKCPSLTKVVVPTCFAENESKWWKERFEKHILPIVALDNFDKDAPLTKYVLRNKIFLVESLISTGRSDLIHKALEYSAKIKPDVLDKLIALAEDKSCADIVSALVEYQSRLYAKKMTKN